MNFFDLSFVLVLVVIHVCNCGLLDGILGFIFCLVLVVIHKCNVRDIGWNQHIELGFMRRKIIHYLGTMSNYTGTCILHLALPNGRFSLSLSPQ